jgi:hypothetical protein
MKEVDEFPGYFVTEDGKIWSSKRNKFLKARITTCGYEQVILKHEGKGCLKYIHRLVAEAFIPNPENKEQVNHIDCNKLNNCVSNLEWTTAKENAQHAWVNGRMENVKKAAKANIKKANKARMKPVMCIETGEEYESAAAASRALGLYGTAVSASISRGGKCANLTWKHKGKEKFSDVLEKEQSDV